jgi:hypothetical protein
MTSTTCTSSLQKSGSKGNTLSTQLNGSSNSNISAKGGSSLFRNICVLFLVSSLVLSTDVTFSGANLVAAELASSTVAAPLSERSTEDASASIASVAAASSSTQYQEQHNVVLQRRSSGIYMPPKGATLYYPNPATQFPGSSSGNPSLSSSGQAHEDTQEGTTSGGGLIGIASKAHAAAGKGGSNSTSGLARATPNIISVPLQDLMADTVVCIELPSLLSLPPTDYPQISFPL